MTTTENDQSDWGNEEGLHLLATFAEQVARNDQAADEAGRTLLAELASLRGKTTIEVTEDPASPTVVKFVALNVAVHVRHEGDGHFIIVDPRRRISDLTFNQATKKIEGPEYPEEKPAPWERPRRRSAVAVIVDEVLTILRERITREGPTPR